MLIGCFFITIAAVYLSYIDKDPINLSTLDEGVYILILIFGTFMISYHLFVQDKRWLNKWFGE